MSPSPKSRRFFFQTAFSVTALIGLATFLACLLAGCSGSGSSPTNAAKVRFINAIPNGGAATFFAEGAFYGSQPFFTTTAYLPVGINTTSLSFGLANDPGTTYTAATVSLSSNTSYSAIVMGRADVASTDPRYPQMVATPDNATAPPTGDINLRIINAAPDQTAVSIDVNNFNMAFEGGYPGVGSYAVFPAGNLVVAAEPTAGGTVASQTLTGIVSGHIYTLFLVETSVAASSQTYGFELIDDTTNTVVS